MSEKLFSKYLPIKGELKVGDMALKPGIGKGSYSIQEDLYCDPYLEEVGPDENTEKFLLAKLFLCSRDVQVGDKWLLTDGDGVTGSNIRKEGDLWGSLMRDNAFKVIGEISPEAIWVEEGEEFDAQQVKLCYIQRSQGDINKWTEVVYKIECPTCGNFH